MMQNAPKTRPSLILRLRNRQDLDAWQQFVEIYQPLVFRLAVSKGFQDSDAADIVQEVLLRVAGAVERWEPDERRGSFRGWLYRIARNLMISFLEKNDRQPVVAGYGSPADLLATVQDSGDLPSPEFDQELDRQIFAWAAGRVESTCQETTWQAFWRTAIDEESPEVVAGQLDMSVGSVYVARCRVIQKLRREVQRFTRDTRASEVSE